MFSVTSVAYIKSKMWINERVVQLNDKEMNLKGWYVLYWMQMFKRTSHNHALIWAIRKANELKLPLVVYEGLKDYYPWVSACVPAISGDTHCRALSRIRCGEIPRAFIREEHYCNDQSYFHRS